VCERMCVGTPTYTRSIIDTPHLPLTDAASCKVVARRRRHDADTERAAAASARSLAWSVGADELHTPALNSPPASRMTSLHKIPALPSRAGVFISLQSTLAL